MSNNPFAGFEGEIALIIESADKPNAEKRINVSVKGTKLRFGVPEGLEGSASLGERAHVIVNTADKSLLAVSDAKAQVLVVRLDELGEHIKGLSPAPAQPSDSPPPKLVKTGHRDTVAGYACEDWEVVSHKGEKLRLCVTDQGASWFELPSIGLPAEHAWARELFDGRHLPLRYIALDESGKQRARIQVEKLERKALPEALFEAPANYKKIDVAQMMQGAARAAGANMPGGSQGQVPPNVQEMLEKMRARVKARQAARGAEH